MKQRNRIPVAPGQVYNRLTVLEEMAEPQGRHVMFLCRCECGALIKTRGAALRCGDSQSCGCYAAEVRRVAGTMRDTHRAVGTPTYTSWAGMHQRCRDPKARNYHWYGGRGIKVCERWSGRTGFQNFLADMGERPDGMTLDRVNPDGHYEPANCRWATWTQQQRNRRNSAAR